MATILDLGFLNYFSIIFVFLLILFIIYAILKYTKVLGDNDGIYAIIALSFAVLFILIKQARTVILEALPWFTILFVVILFILLAVKMFDVDDSVLKSAITSGPYGKTIIYWVITLVVIILLYSFSQSFGQNIGPYLNSSEGISSPNTNSGTNFVSHTSDSLRGNGDVATGNFNTNLGATLFHPKVLGLIVVLLIASFSIRMLSSKAV